MTRIKELFKELYGDEAEERTRAFIVDDEPAVARAAGRSLRSPGTGIITTAEVESPVQAIEDLGSENLRASVALIVTDYYMPGKMTGIRLANHIRTVIGETRVPVLLYSSCPLSVFGEEVAMAIAWGTVDAFLEKPFSPEELLAAVERAIVRRLELVKMSQGGDGQEGETVPGQAAEPSAEQGAVDSGQEGETPQK